jgi:hypothetical protein
MNSLLSASSLAIFLCALTPLHAAPITLTLTGTATGSIGASSFTSAAVTIVGIGDTTAMTLVGGDPNLPLTAETITIAGIGTATITDPAQFRNVASGPNSVLVSLEANQTLLGLFGGALVGYDFLTSIGPIAGAGSHTPGMSLNTTLGILQLAPTSATTFTAVVGDVPEPATYGLAAAGLLLAIAMKRRGKER